MFRKLSVIVLVFICAGWISGNIASPEVLAAEESHSEDLEKEGFWPAVSLPYTRVVLSSELDENVKHVMVEEGDHVDKGDVILKFDTRQIDAQIQVMRKKADYTARMCRQRARVEYLESEYNRSKKLAEGESVISESKLDNDRTKLAIARAELQDLKRQAAQAESELENYLARKENYVIKSPVRGIVSRIMIDVGEMARQGEKIVEVVDPNTLELRVHLPESMAGDVKIGQKATIRFHCVGNKTLTGSVFYVAPYVESSSGTFLVKVLAQEQSQQIMPGMGCELQFHPFQVRAKTSSPAE